MRETGICKISSICLSLRIIFLRKIEIHLTKVFLHKLNFIWRLKQDILLMLVKNLSRCKILWFLSVFSITIFRIKRMHVSGNLEVNAREQGKWIGNFRVAIHVTWLAVIFHGNFSRDRSKVKMATNGQRNDMYALGVLNLASEY